MIDPRLETTDARQWAEAFAETRVQRRAEDDVDIADDEDTMMGWFANAIECGRSAAAVAPDSASEAVKGSLGEFEEVEEPVPTRPDPGETSRNG